MYLVKDAQTLFIRAWSTLLLQILFAVKSTGVRDCQTSAPRCVSSADLSTERFTCFLRGRVPHISNSSLYYRCPDDNHFACLCTCPPGKAFDDIRGRCRRLAFLGVSRDGPRDLPYGESRDLRIAAGQTDKPLPSRVLGDQSTQNVVIKVLSKNKTHANPQGMPGDVQGMPGGDTYIVREVIDVNRLGAESAHAEPEVLQRTLPSSEASPSSGRVIITDDSPFPAWAIALVVLCVVIVMVLIVLIIY